ncbi:hypothetical protein BC833DRAFT_590505 [Globomyces pollinis-pini]|nr:hypothetical protein BC833DRAFT_590505 [Globomyces pollinis-pini]
MPVRLGCVSFNPRNTPIQINRSSRRLISIYVHYPYCTSKCTYCNFNKYTLPANLNYLRLEKAYLTDLTHDLSELDQTKQTINSIYFGGGTPSLAKPTLVENILKLLFIDLNFKPAVDLEVTLEANPTRLEAQSLKDFKAAGVNRLSLGIQSLDNDDLKFFGRDHNVNEALQAITLAQSLFENVSLDFIWGRPGHTTDQWELELSQILSFGANHLSLYQLTVENGTPLAKLASKSSNRNLFPCEDTLVDMFQLTQELTQRGGYGQYEVSSYAKDGLSSNRSKHNQGYWNGNDYIGIGPGAHGRLFKADNIRYRTYRVTHIKL